MQEQLRFGAESGSSVLLAYDPGYTHAANLFTFRVNATWSFMRVRFSSQALADLCGSAASMDRKWGATLGVCLRRRLKLLVASPTLDLLREYPGVLPLKLKTDAQDQIAIGVRKDCGIIVVPDHRPVPRRSNGELAAKEIDQIIVIEVSVHGA